MSIKYLKFVKIRLISCKKRPAVWGLKKGTLSEIKNLNVQLAIGEQAFIRNLGGSNVQR